MSIQQTKSADEILLDIIKSDFKDFKKVDAMIVTGPRLVNKTWQRVVDKLRKNGMDWEQIVQKMN